MALRFKLEENLPRKVEPASPGLLTKSVSASASEMMSMSAGFYRTHVVDLL
jgi:hypothetical protein